MLIYFLLADAYELSCANGYSLIFLLTYLFSLLYITAFIAKC